MDNVEPVAQEVNNETLQLENEVAVTPEVKEELPEKIEDEKPKSLDELPLPGDEEEKPKQKELPKWVEKKLSRKEREAEQHAAEAAMYKAEVEKLRNSAQSGLQPQFQDTTAPMRENFNTEEEYIDARIDYKNQKNIQVMNQKKQHEALVDAENNFQKNIHQAREEGLDKYDDFEEKTSTLFSPSFPNNRAMAEAIVDSPYKSDILYFLGTYSQEAKKIALLNPVQAVKRIAELEQRFESRKKSNATKAPAPIEPVNGQAAKSNPGNPEKMDSRDFKNWYENRYKRK